MKQIDPCVSFGLLCSTALTVVQLLLAWAIYAGFQQHWFVGVLFLLAFGLCIAALGVLQRKVWGGIKHFWEGEE